MNALRKALADYFVVRRALGFKLYRAEKLLGQFLTFVEDRGEDHLTTEAALAWATLPKRGRTWAFARLSVVRRFANHLRGIDPATEVPSTHLLVQQKGRATPYLYSESDIAALIAAAGTLRTPHRVATFRTLIALLAVTGMRVGEAIGLDRDDFDSVIGLLTIRNASSASLANCRCFRAPWLHWLIILVETTARKSRRIHQHCWSLRLAPGSATWASSPSFVKLWMSPASSRALPHAVRGCMTCGTDLPSIPSLTDIEMAGSRGTGSRCCRPTSATSILSAHTGISRLRQSC
jgi:integrase